MIKRKLKKIDTEKEPYLVWNEFIDLLANEDELDLSEIQKNAKRAFVYDSEIQNGGHLQYFENERLTDYSKIIKSLIEIGASEQANILEKASLQFLAKKRKPILNVLSFVKKAKEDEYSEFDNLYYNIKPDMNNYLNDYLEKYKNEFIDFD